MSSSQKVILIGLMGSGKSTIGKLLAQELDWPYLDNDTEMSQITGLSERELSMLPIMDLHNFESRYLQDLNNKPAPFVAGAAASVVDYQENIEILKSVTSIYLRIPPEQIIERAGDEGIGRGNIQGDRKAVLIERFLHRDPIYREVARYTIDLGAIPRSDAKRILTFLKSQP